MPEREAERLEPAYPSSTERLASAKAEIDTEVAAMTVVAGRAHDLVAEHQAARASRWRAGVSSAHSRYLDDLTRHRARAEAAVQVSGDALGRAADATAAARARYEDALAALGPGSGPGNPRNPEPYPGRELGTPRSEMVAWVFVPLAVGADIAAFYTVLALLFRTSPFLIVIGTIGFAAAAVGLSHAIGIGIKRRRLRMRHTSSGLYWGSLLAWAALGVIAFLARLLVEPVPPGQELRPLVLAATFAVLYVVSGVLAMGAAYAAYSPGLWAVRRAARILEKRTDAEAAAHRGNESAIADRKSWDEQQDRVGDRVATELAVVEADDAVAEKYAQLAILRRLDELGASQ